MMRPSGKCVSFEGIVRVHEHERILVDAPDNDVYACLAIGWAHVSSNQCLMDDSSSSYDDDDDDSRTHAGNYSQSQRYSASERLKVLNEYGFPMQEVLFYEMTKKKKCAQSGRACDGSPRSSSQRKGGVKRLLTGWGSSKKIF